MRAAGGNLVVIAGPLDSESGERLTCAGGEFLLVEEGGDLLVGVSES
jgi:hypothetical protein